MTVTASDGRVLLGPRERIGTITLVKGALARMRAAGWRAVIVWLVAGGAALVVQMGSTRAGVQIAAAEPTAGYLGYILASSAVAGLSAAWGIRLFLRGAAGWLKPDRGLLEAGGIYAGMTAVMLAISMLFANEGEAEDPRLLTIGVVGFVLFFLVAFAAVRLTLWPVARMAGRPDLTPAAAWRLMRRATRGLLLGYVLLALPVIVVAVIMQTALMAATGDAGLGLRTSVFQWVGAAVAVSGYGLVATLWTLRVEAPATVADVFD